MSKVKSDCILCGENLGGGYICKGLSEMICEKKNECPFYKSNTEYKADGTPIIKNNSDAKSWLDAHIAWRNRCGLLLEFSEDIRVIDQTNCTDKKIQVSNADLLANQIGVKVYMEEASETLEYHFFMYKGYRVFSLEDR